MGEWAGLETAVRAPPTCKWPVSLTPKGEGGLKLLRREEHRPPRESIPLAPTGEARAMDTVQAGDSNRDGRGVRRGLGA
jgi:hypothetical protein